MRLARELACNEIVELVTAYLDDALPAEDHLRARSRGRRRPLSR